MRDKLIELIEEAAIQYLDAYANAGKIADYLIANGVTFAECLVDTNKTSPMTNGDRIRGMTDEELAEEMVFYTGYRESAWREMTYCNLLTGRDDTRENAIKGTIEWLKQPAEGE